MVIPYNIKINSAGIGRNAPDWHWDTGKAAWDDFDLWTVLRGEGEMETPEKTYELHPGDCFILRGAYEGYVGRNTTDENLIAPFIHFDFVDTKGRPVRLPVEQLPPLYRRIDDLDFFERLTRRLVTAVREKGPEHPVTRLWMDAVMLEVFRVDEKQELSGLERDQAVMVDKICAEINEHPGAGYTVEDLAAKAFYTPDHFTRIFKKHKKVTPQQYILKRRVDRARHLLRNSSYTISRIAEILGYTDVYFFSKQFREKTGTSPRSYRQGGK